MTANRTSLRIVCPDCNTTVTIKDALEFESDVNDRAVAHLRLLKDPFEEHFTGHVIAAPEAHPTFTLPLDV